MVVLAVVGPFALPSLASAQEQKPPIAFAETGAVTIVCGDVKQGRQTIEVLNETATKQTVDLRLSRLRDESGRLREASGVCDGVSLTKSLRIEPGESRVAVVEARDPPPGGTAVYSGTIAAFTPEGPVVRRPLKVREAAAGAAAGTAAKPLVSTVSATIYRARPWGNEEIEVPVMVAPDEELLLGDKDVVGGLAGGGHTGVVTYAGKHKQSGKTTNVELAVDGLGPGSYEGDLDLVPTADEGKVTLKLTVKDWWPFAALAILGGVILGLAVQRFSNVTVPKRRLLKRVSDVKMHFRTWGDFSLNDLATRQDGLKRQIERETAPYYLNLDAKVIEALETKIKALEDEIDQIDTVQETMSGLEQSLDAVKAFPIDTLPLDDEDKTRGEPLLTRNARDLLKGKPLSIAQLKKRLASVDATINVADDMSERLLPKIAFNFGELKKLHKDADGDLKKGVGTVLDALEATTWKVWHTPDATGYTELDPWKELDAIDDSIADLVAKHRIPPLRELVGGGGGGGTLDMRPLDGGEELEADDEELADEEARKARWQGYGVAAIAAVVALVTAFHELYIGKPFGTLWDYIWAASWGLTTQVVLATLATAIGGIAGLRSLGQKATRA
jgi:hypothetical protein